MTPRRPSAAAAGLRRLRWRLTGLNFVLCALVLLAMGLTLLSMAEQQLENAAWRQLNGSLDSVTAYVVNQKVISNNWLVRQEMSSLAVIGVEDGGRPFLFRGAFVPATDRSLLLALSWWLSGRSARPVADSMRRQNEFIAAASHELKSPLAVISTSAAVLGEVPEQDAALRQTIRRECLRMGRLVSDLLTLARSESGSWSMQLTTLNPETLLEELTEKFLPLTAQKGQRLRLDLPEDPLPDVTGDAQRLEQLLTILLDNACAYTQPGGTITLAAATGKKKLLLHVKDNGPARRTREQDAAFVYAREVLLKEK